MRKQEAEQILLSGLISIMDDPVFYDPLVEGLNESQRHKIDRTIQRYQGTYIKRHTRINNILVKLGVADAS